MSRRRTRAGSSRIAVAYLRVSTDEQRLGPEAQRAAIEAWAARTGTAIAAWHTDQGVSGSADITDRPGLVAALAELRLLGAGVLVVAKRDRVARDMAIACAIERAVENLGAVVVAADGNGNGTDPAGVFMRRILDAASEHERGIIRARTKAALAVKAARGERVSRRPPWGWRVGPDGVHLEAEPREAAVVLAALELADAGRSYRAIAAELAAAGHRNRLGRPIGVTELHKMIARARGATEEKASTVVNECVSERV